MGPRGEEKMPNNPPNWNPNDEIGRRNMKEYRTLLIRGIKEAVPRTSNENSLSIVNKKRTKRQMHG